MPRKNALSTLRPSRGVKTGIAYLEEIGIERLADLKGADPHQVAMRIDIALGRRHMNRLGVEALANLIALANDE